jgi:hypothetical protein
MKSSEKCFEDSLNFKMVGCKSFTAKLVRAKWSADDNPCQFQFTPSGISHIDAHSHLSVAMVN